MMYYSFSHTYTHIDNLTFFYEVVGAGEGSRCYTLNDVTSAKVSHGLRRTMMK